MSYIEKFRSLLKIHNVVDSKLVRVGNKDSDGGYVLPDKLLVDVDVIYNYGVGNEITFEEDFLEQYPDKVVRSFDHTIEAYPHTDKIVDYHNEGLAPYKTDDCDSFENHVVRFNDIDKKILLKIDVEGAEYDYFNSSDFKIINNNVYGILLEIHSIDKNLEDFVQMLEKLSEKFVCVSLHANNFGLIFELEGYILPSVIEVCFVKKVFYNLNLEVNSSLLSDLSIKCNKELDEFYWLLSSREDNNNYYNQYSIKLIKEYHRLHHEVHLRDTEITRLHGECAVRDTEINRLHSECAVRDGEINRLHSEIHLRNAEIERLNKHIGSIYASLSWKITKPLRIFKNILKRIILFPRSIITFIKQIIKKIIIKLAKKIMGIRFIKRIGKSYLNKHPQLKIKIKRKMVEKGLWHDPYMQASSSQLVNLGDSDMSIEQVRQQYGNDIANIYNILTKKK